mmetsp:Transcript_58906/g.140584  ORF Transcript_58906/g.140584 Transcript_58906/m.140584 type:complete len:895 (-) Transcript_58906:73-2757(-)
MTADAPEAGPLTTCLRPGVCGFVIGEELARDWDMLMVVLSWMVASVGAFTTIRTVAHLRFCDNSQWYWTLVTMAGLAFGVLAVWDMHQVGMYALHLKATSIHGGMERMEIEYTLDLAVTSALAAWVVGGLSIWIVTGRHVSVRNKLDKELAIRILVSAGLVACGVCTMHYMGMLSMAGQFDMTWDAGIIALSWVIAYVVATVGLTILMAFPANILGQVLAGLIIGGAVCSMHYTGMHAATYTIADRETSVTGNQAVEIPGLHVVIAGLMLNTMISIPLQHYGEEQRSKYEKQMHKAHEQELQSNIDLASTVADALVNYDLDLAGRLLQNQGKSQLRALRPLELLLRNLKVYRAFLPHALFDQGSATAQAPNEVLQSNLASAQTSSKDIEMAVARIRDPAYTLSDFHTHMVRAYPELQLYLSGADGTQCSSGHTGAEEYQRTLGALYTVFAFMRLDIDGKHLMSFGVDSSGNVRTEPDPIDKNGEKKLKFFANMDWNKLRELMLRAGILAEDDIGKVSAVPERTIGMLTLTAIHDIMKNTNLLPTVQPEHVPYHGYAEGDEIVDHDLALAYVLENFPALLPSFKLLTPAQRAPVLFTQAKMNFNNGWLVQGEAPPGTLFKEFKAAIQQGRASEGDVSFYFVHWLTDLAGAETFEGRPWPGAEKLTAKLPPHVLVAFLKSFKFVERLATATEVQVMEAYLHSRAQELQLRIPRELAGSSIASMRLALMAQGFEQEIVDILVTVPEVDRSVLTFELALTACKEQFMDCPPSMSKKVKGPALLVYYAPALIQRAGRREAAGALIILARVLVAARRVFPLDVRFQEQACTVRIDALKVLSQTEMLKRQPWYLKRTGSTTAEVVQGEVTKGDPTRSSSLISQVGLDSTVIDLPPYLTLCI